MKRSLISIGVLVILAAGAIAFFMLRSPSVQMTALQETQIPETTRQLVMPAITESGKPYVLRAYGSGEGYEYVGYSIQGSLRGLFIFSLDGELICSGAEFEIPFSALHSFVFDDATHQMTSLRAYGGATDARITKVIGTTTDGRKFEAVPQNGFWWLWVNGSGKWSKFEAVDRSGRVLYTEALRF